MELLDFRGVRSTSGFQPKARVLTNVVTVISTEIESVSIDYTLRSQNGVEWALRAEICSQFSHEALYTTFPAFCRESATRTHRRSLRYTVADSRRI